MANAKTEKLPENHNILETDFGPLCVSGKIHAAMAGVTKDIAPVGKDGRNEFSDYSFRRIEDFMNSANEAMSGHGVSLRPVKIETVKDEHLTAGNKIKHGVGVLVTYIVQHEDGSFVLINGTGYSEDYSDKALSQAMTAAYKVALQQAFCIPSPGMTDADANSPDPVSEKSGRSRAEGQKKITEVDAKAIAEYMEWLNLKIDASDLRQLNEIFGSLSTQRDVVKNTVWPHLKSKAESGGFVYSVAVKSYVPIEESNESE